MSAPILTRRDAIQRRTSDQEFPGFCKRRTAARVLPVGAMSGGERTRLRCCLLMLSRANCLILDEPTNHLDIAAVETLEAALEGFDGDSSGLGELVTSFTTVRNQGGLLKLLNLTRRVQDLLQITKLLTVFEVFNSEAEALKTMK